MADSQSEEKNRRGIASLVRLYWMCIGNILLFVCLCLAMRANVAFPSIIDAGCLLSALLLVGARHVDVRRFNGMNGAGDTPATMDDWKRYSAIVLGGTAVCWAAIRFLLPLL